MLVRCQIRPSASGHHGLLIIPIFWLASSLCLLSTNKLVCGGRSGAIWLPSHHPSGCCTPVVDEKTLPLHVKCFECLEKHYINYYILLQSIIYCLIYLKWLNITIKLLNMSNMNWILFNKCTIINGLCALCMFENSDVFFLQFHLVLLNLCEFLF